MVELRAETVGRQVYTWGGTVARKPPWQSWTGPGVVHDTFLASPPRIRCLHTHKIKEIDVKIQNFPQSLFIDKNYSKQKPILKLTRGKPKSKDRYSAFGIKKNSRKSLVLA